jgi:hypothetical protein
MTNDKAIHFNIIFEDLTFERQEEIIKALLPRLQAEAETEGKEFLKREWHDPKPTTWQEAYVRSYDIEYESWQDEVNNGKIVTPSFIWESYQEAHVEEIARQKAQADLAAQQAAQLEAQRIADQKHLRT